MLKCISIIFLIIRLLAHAENGRNLLFSVLILRSHKGAYYHTGGSSPNGMKVGASIYLMYQVLNILKNENLHILNLGGARPNEEGLKRFKLGFGPKEILLEEATFSLISPIKWKLLSSAIFFKKILGQF